MGGHLFRESISHINFFFKHFIKSIYNKIFATVIFFFNRAIKKILKVFEEFLFKSLVLCLNYKRMIMKEERIGKGDEYCRSRYKVSSSSKMINAYKARLMTFKRSFLQKKKISAVSFHSQVLPS